jgi:thiazole/oxazole-forming peptide maturase SagD family component
MWFRLRPLLVCDKERLLVRIGDRVISMGLDSMEEPTSFVERLDSEGLAALRNRCRSSAELSALEMLLLREGVVVPTREQQTLPPGFHPLRRALEAASETDAELLQCLVTADEALFLKNAAPEHLRRGLRMFISRLQDPYRLATYGTAVSHPSAIAVLGDIPDQSDIDWLLTVEPPTGVSSVSLKSRTFTGTVTASGVGLGRLSEGEVLRTQSLTVGAATTTWVVASGHTAHPNLGVLNPFEDPDSFVAGTTGVAATEEEARVKAFAEAIERFVAGDLDPETLVQATAEELQSAWLDPRDVVRYSDRQKAKFGLSEFDVNAETWWVGGVQHDRDLFVPAALVFSPFPAVPRWLHWSATSSNGVAAHTTYDQAARSAWLELVERDAFQRARLTLGRNRVVRITPESVPASVRGLAALAAEYGRTTLLRLPSPTQIPVCLARIDTTTGIGLGMAAAPREDLAASKALTEAVAQAIRPFSHEVEVADVRSPGDHAALYASADWRTRIDWMLTAPLSAMSRVARSCNIPDTAIVIRFPNETSTDLAVCRAIDPTLIPLTFGYDTDPVGRADVAELAAIGGWDCKSPIDPHPFA